MSTTPDPSPILEEGPQSSLAEDLATYIKLARRPPLTRWQRICRHLRRYVATW